MHPALPFAAPLLGLAVVGASFLTIPRPPAPTGAQLGELAIIYFKLNDGRSAATFDQALALEPGNVRTRYGSGVAALETKRFDEAERAFEAVLKADPKHIDAVYALAAVYQKTRRNHLVEGLLKQMIAIDPRDSRPYEDLAQIEILRGGYAAAREYLTTYLSLVPRNARNERELAERKVAKLNELLAGKAAASPVPTPAPSKKP